MMLVKCLEVLRGEPIRRFAGDPMKIPCVETSDAACLCKDPVVSVCMITYNQEPYIRRAIESVMMQRTDFPFELVVGEDCSTDRTREICLECQKRHPDRIRVLWANQNVSKLGGNGRRVRAHCRGEYIAFCEGDDYWTDPLKLQKQVDYIRETDSAMCVASCEWRVSDGRVRRDVYTDERKVLAVEDVIGHYFHTTTILMRCDAHRRCVETYADMPYWYDTILEICLASMGRVCHIPDVVSVYNWTGQGAAGSPGSRRHLILRITQHVEMLLWGPTLAKPAMARFCVENIHEILSGSGSRCFSPVERLALHVILCRVALSCQGVLALLRLYRELARTFCRHLVGRDRIC